MNEKNETYTNLVKNAKIHIYMIKYINIILTIP